MNNPFTVAGKKILVTGASRGIGRTCAELLAQLGARIVLVARSADALESIRGSLSGEGHIVVPWDLSDSNTVEKILPAACVDGVKLDGMLYAAGIGPAFPLKVLNFEEMQRVFRINFFSFMMLSKAFVKKCHSDGGSIVAVSSVAALAGWQGLSVYGASKGALNAAIRTLAVELAPHFRVNAIVPSNIKTDMLASLLETLDPEKVAQIERKQPLGFGKPEDVAGAAAYLLSDAGKFVTGTSLVVDGGYLAL